MAKTQLPVELRKLGDNVRRIRNSLKMSQERLAELAALNARNIRRIEAGEINTLITTIARIRKALGCKWDDLMPPDWKQ